MAQKLPKEVSNTGLASAATFVAVGLVNLSATLFPLRLGDTNWELAAFGEISATIGLLAIGLAMLGFGGARSGRPVPVIVAVVIAVFAGSLTGFGVLVLSLDAPLVVSGTRGVGDAGVLARLLLTKSLLLNGCYTLGLWTIAWQLGRVFGTLRRTT
jgi:hypothetical protein